MNIIGKLLRNKEIREPTWSGSKENLEPQSSNQDPFIGLGYYATCLVLINYNIMYNFQTIFSKRCKGSLPLLFSSDSRFLAVFHCSSRVCWIAIFHPPQIDLMTHYELRVQTVLQN